MTRNRWIILVVITAVLLIAGGVWFTQSNASGEETADTNTTAANGDAIVSVTRGDLASTASASGQLQAQRQANLSFTTPGLVTAVLVSVGDEAAAGDPLIQLSTTDLDRAVRTAEQTLIIQQANHDRLLQGASDLDTAVAQSALASAQQSLDDLLAGPNSATVAAQESRVRTANANVQSAFARLQQARNGGGDAALLEAQRALDQAIVAQREAEEAHVRTFDCETINGETVCTGGSAAEQAARIPAQQANAQLAAAQEQFNQVANGNPDTISQLEANLAAATADRDAAQAQLEQALAGPTAAQIAQAEASVAQAQLNLDNLVRGATAEQIQQSEAQLRQAEISLELAQKRLAEATLTAPFAGIITAVNVTVGEQASGPVVSLLDVDSLEVVLSVDEIDIGALSDGQAAELRFESYPDTAVAGEIAAIAPSNTPNNSTIVAYEVHLALGDHDLPLRVGMTANANLTTGERNDVLLVPNRAITIDRTTGTYTVRRLNATAAEGFEEVEIQIGLRDNQFTQVLDGLNEGDQLLIGNSIPSAFGPGGGGPGGPPGN